MNWRKRACVLHAPLRAFSSPTHRYRGRMRLPPHVEEAWMPTGRRTMDGLWRGKGAGFPRARTCVRVEACAGTTGGELQLLGSWVLWKRRVAQEDGGERRACLRPWMAEFAPAAGFRATQGTATAPPSPRGLRVPFLLVTFLLGKQRKVTRWPEGTVKAPDLGPGTRKSWMLSLRLS